MWLEVGAWRLPEFTNKLLCWTVQYTFFNITIIGHTIYVNRPNSNFSIWSEIIAHCAKLFLFSAAEEMYDPLNSDWDKNHLLWSCFGACLTNEQWAISVKHLLDRWAEKALTVSLQNKVYDAGATKSSTHKLTSALSQEQMQWKNSSMFVNASSAFKIWV